jgi:2-heptyl-3-hydroxy-4(1H)-quinolone synthase
MTRPNPYLSYVTWSCRVTRSAGKAGAVACAIAAASGACYRPVVPDGPRILIVGAGIAGLALAAGLERFGITPVVAEIGDASLPRGLALMLTGNAAMALRRVGLDEMIIDRGIVLEGIAHSGPLGNRVDDDHDLRPSNARYAPVLGITRDGLVSGLGSATRAPIRYATTVASVGGRVRQPEVVFSDGTHGQFDLVVGADGINSAVRKAIYPGIEPAYRSFCAWRTVMACAHWDPVFRFSSTPGCLLGSFPVGPGLVYAFLLFHCAAVPVMSRDERLARFKELSARFRADVAALIAQQQDPASVIFVPVHEVQVPSYHRGRMVLIGDAAHGFPPLLAQGAAMAIEDAVALAESLGRSRDVGQALRSYESRRRPRVETIRSAVRRVTIMRGLEGPVTPELLEQHPAVYSASLKAFDELIEDPFTPVQGTT